MEKKLAILLDKFTGEMSVRLDQKTRQGFKGWDKDLYTNMDIPRRLHNKSLKILTDSYKGVGCGHTKQDLVDIANLAMFLYNKAEE